MKYFHIIYNSSEKPMDGGVGFGIRTVTEGTPDKVINIVKRIEFFTDDWDSYDTKPTPSLLKENPSSIEAIAKNYAITNIMDEQGCTFYVIARRAYVGFDYGFYKNGMPTRPGNYVIDYYIFETTPESSVYEILYEKPLVNSNHFIPKSVKPTDDNLEMKEISVGSQPPLPAVEKPFSAVVEDGLDKDVVKLFLTYLSAKQHGKKLVVKASKEQALRLTADFYRMLDPESAKQIRTYVNLRSEGINDSFDIFYIHEDYPHQVYPGLYVYMELDCSSMPDTDEARTFGHDLENLVIHSFVSNKPDITSTLKWLLTPEFLEVKSMSKVTNDAFYTYCIKPDLFVYEHLKDAHGNFNDEFLKVLSTYVKKNAHNAQRINALLISTMNKATEKDVIALMKDYQHFISFGFNLTEVFDSIKQHICEELLIDVNVFKSFLESFEYEFVEKFFVKSKLENKSEFLSTPLLDSYLLRLYKWFFTSNELQNKEVFIYQHFIKRGIERDKLLALVDDLYGNDADSKVKLFIYILHQEHTLSSNIWPCLEHYLAKTSFVPDFLKEFDAYLEDSSLAQMFYFYIKKHKEQYSSCDKIPYLTDLISRNTGLKQLIVSNYQTDDLFNGFYHDLKELSKNKPEEALKAIQNNFDYLYIKDQKYSILSIYLQIAVSDNYDIIKLLSKDEIKLLYNEINAYHNGKMFHELLPTILQMAKDGQLSAYDVASNYCQYNPNVHTIEMIQIICPSVDWIDMMSAIIYDLRNKPFVEAYRIADEVNMSHAAKESFLMKCYRKEYKNWKRNNKIKKIFLTFKKLFTLTFKKKLQKEKVFVDDNNIDK